MSSQSSALRVNSKTKHCYVCGPENARGMQVPFFPDGPHGCRALYTARAEHSGWPGMLHGGVTFALMDEALGWAVHFQGLHGVTARADTRFRQPVAIGAKLIIRAWTLAASSVDDRPCRDSTRQPRPNLGCGNRRNDVLD